jgi:hypothetical protein
VPVFPPVLPPVPTEVVQLLFTQVEPPVQAWPQLPQFALSLAVLTQALLQSIWPPEQVHWLLTHVEPPEQT